ncbi:MULTISPECIES: ABC transporter ATP-binding protein [unclassified Pseudodesulfovibrio]|uniref:ABC transporter ATP-binding protein n=1 Tax=unclassified Pseudodesulfovibrio TaxID=2661612 RepID=UPI000FEBDC84|nr:MULTISPECIES: ABC transporter ATP-binding protein [unclassified Pseudodesulfovibrio]MCJ2164716.1 ABC transporter ATP-binding protein [Pseudodesulfovibrio sp. S3-i]RWU04095.1 ABC transporter ATP-binding protein [Pseudodesulfovibrio sp. S3]
MTAPLLDIQDLRTYFYTRAGVVKAVNGISLTINKGEVIGIVGESGSGKSVTGFSIMGLVDRPGKIAGGSIKFKGRELVGQSEAQWRSFRGNEVAMIFQDPMMTLNPVLRIDTQMIEAIRAHEKVSKAEALRRSIEALALVGIPSPEERIKAYPHQFSGGMRQRVAIATGLLNNPDLIIADEPTTALDVTIQAQILSEMQKLCRKTDMALMWITHDLTVIAGLAHRVAVMYAGTIIEEGPVQDVLDRPLHPYTEGLIGSVPGRNKRGGRLYQIPGTTPSMINLPEGCPFRMRCPRTTDECLEVPPVIVMEDGRKICCFHPGEQSHMKNG